MEANPLWANYRPAGKKNIPNTWKYSKCSVCFSFISHVVGFLQSLLAANVLLNSYIHLLFIFSSSLLIFRIRFSRLLPGKFRKRAGLKCNMAQYKLVSLKKRHSCNAQPESNKENYAKGANITSFSFLIVEYTCVKMKFPLVLRCRDAQILLISLSWIIKRNLNDHFICISVLFGTSRSP